MCSAFTHLGIEFDHKIFIPKSEWKFYTFMWNIFAKYWSLIGRYFKSISTGGSTFFWGGPLLMWVLLSVKLASHFFIATYEGYCFFQKWYFINDWYLAKFKLLVGHIFFKNSQKNNTIKSGSPNYLINVKLFSLATAFVNWQWSRLIIYKYTSSVYYIFIYFQQLIYTCYIYGVPQKEWELPNMLSCRKYIFKRLNGNSGHT